MNRSYLPENRCDMHYDPVSVSPVREGASAGILESVLVFFDLLIAFFTSSAIRTTLRVIGVLLCFVAFLFVIGSVEAEVLGFGAGVLSALLLCAIAFLCVYRPKK